MAINFPSSPATNDTFTGPTGLEYIFDGVKWRSFKPTEPVVGTFNANSAISLSAGGTNQNIVLTPSGTGIVTVPTGIGVGTTTTASGRAITLNSASNYFGLALQVSGSTQAQLMQEATGSLYIDAGVTNNGGSIVFRNVSGTERMRISNTGNVGIGTANPTTSLEIYNATSTALVVSGDGTCSLVMVRASNDASGAGLNFRKSRGTVGSRLAVNSGDQIATSNYTAYDGANLVAVSQIQGRVETITGTDNISGMLQFFTRPDGSAAALAERVRITSAGNVGIGTTTPTTLLSANGVASFGAGSAAAPAITTIGDLDTGIYFPAANQLGVSVNGAVVSKFGTSGQTVFGDSLQLEGTDTTLKVVSGTYGFLFLNVGNSAVNGLHRITSYTNTLGAGSLAFFSGGTESMRITSAGFVGIGNTAPSAALEVTGNIKDTLGLVRAAPIQTKSGAYVVVAGDAGSTIYISTGGVTINASVLSAGDMITIVNNSASPQTITAGVSVTFRLAGTATTGNRTLAQYGMATFLCVVGGATPTLHCSGAGLT
jgi:hypothetical protein